MKITVDKSLFREMFEKSSRANDFSHEGLDVLFDYLDETYEDDYEFDLIEICCEFADYNEDGLVNEFEHLLPWEEWSVENEIDMDEDVYPIEYIKALVDEIEKHTTVLPYYSYESIDGNIVTVYGWIVQNF